MVDNKTYFVTSALPYVNNVLHLGNIIGSVLSADVYARAMRKMNKQVLFICGTDEYGTTTEIKALQEGLTCQEICDKYYKLQKQSLKWFNISCDVFGRTTTETQTELAQEIFLNLWKNNYLEEQELEQLYCTNCNMFIADRYIIGECYHDKCSGFTKGDQCDTCDNLIKISKLEKKWCSVCKNIPDLRKTNHLYLKLELFKKDLKEYFLTDKIKFLSPNAYNITKTWLSKNLENRCITRDLVWGTPVPKVSGLEKYWNKVFYVWFDAPIGYLSILKNYKPDEWNKWLNGYWIQFMAKDNVPFHTIVFPATILGSKFESNLVTHLSSTEYLDYEKKKFSKSNNVGIFCDQIEKISESLNIDEDYWRYYLIKIRPETSDSTFSWEDFAYVIKGELSNKIGNLINRAIALGKKYYNDKKSVRFDLTNFSALFLELETNILSVLKYYENFEFREALKCINRISELGNEFMNQYSIWNLIKENSQTNEIYFGILSYICCIVAHLFEPIMPNKSKQIIQHFDMNNISFDNLIKKEGIIHTKYDNYKILFNQISMKQLVECGI